MNTMTTTTTTQQSKENEGVGCIDDNKDSNDKDVKQGQAGISILGLSREG